MACKSAAERDRIWRMANGRGERLDWRLHCRDRVGVLDHATAVATEVPDGSVVSETEMPGPTSDPPPSPVAGPVAMLLRQNWSFSTATDFYRPLGPRKGTG